LSEETKASPGTWDAEALLTKAQRYFEIMLELERDDWRFALWSSLALELLARAALADYSPALLADPKDWNNVYSALGFTPTAKKFIPKSIGAAEVIDRLTAIVPLDSELAGFCLRHTTQRNAELHSGDVAFEGVKHSSWLPLYYKACKVLIEDMDSDLSLLVGVEETRIAEKMIATLADNAANAVKGTINAHKVVWEKKEKAERDRLTAQATLWATRHAGHRVKCPACSSDALVSGDPISVPQKAIKDDVITESQEHLPSKFECIACGMKIAGLSQLNAAALGDVYKQTMSYDAAEYYAKQDDMHDYEPDNNEPMDESM
jgi:hypothetical protein